MCTCVTFHWRRFELKGIIWRCHLKFPILGSSVHLHSNRRSRSSLGHQIDSSFSGVPIDGRFRVLRNKIQVWIASLPNVPKVLALVGLRKLMDYFPSVFSQNDLYWLDNLMPDRWGKFNYFSTLPSNMQMINLFYSQWYSARRRRKRWIWMETWVKVAVAEELHSLTIRWEYG